MNKLPGIPDKPKRTVKVYREFEEAPDFDYRLFKVCLLYMICVFMMVFGSGGSSSFGLPSNMFVIGLTGCISVFIALIAIFYNLYFRKLLIDEYTEEVKNKVIGSIFGFLTLVWFTMGWITESVYLWFYPVMFYFIMFIVFSMWHSVYIINIVSNDRTNTI